MSDWILAAAVATSVFAALWTVKHFTIVWLRKFANRTTSSIDDLVIYSVSRPINILLILAGIEAGQMLIELSPRQESLLHGSVKALFIATAILILNRFVVGLYKRRRFGSENELLQSQSNLIIMLIRTIILGLGTLVVLDSLGISITPLLASLGIGSIAVALAFQDTLANIFAGIYLLLDRPLRFGQTIRLESGEEGVVDKISWRSTRIRTIPNNIVIIPNTKLASSQFTNYDLPEAGVTFNISVGVGYESNLDQVERITRDVAQSVLKDTEGGSTSFEPLVRFQTFGDSSINFVVMLRAETFGAQALIRHAFIKALHARFKKEGIVIPYPIRTLEIPERVRTKVSAA